MKRTLALVIAIASTSGCASTYWVSADDARRADRGGYSEREGVPATRETDGKAVHLRPSTIDGQLARIGEAPVRVRPRTTGARTAGYIMLGIGGALAIGAGIAGATANQPGCHDESCWLGPLVAGSTMGAIGGSLFIIGGSLAIAGSAER